VPRDYDTKLAAARRSHPAVVFMGDSCTEFGTYPHKTTELLTSKAPRLATGVTLGVGGWSSEQGLAQLRRDEVRIGRAERDPVVIPAKVDRDDPGMQRKD
jgi:hypothetical protein